MQKKFKFLIIIRFIDIQKLLFSIFYSSQISIKFKFSYAFYNIPTFGHAWTIPVSTTASGLDPCRLFQIRNSTLYRMGQSNIISKWNLDSFAYTQQRLYQTLDSSINVSNLAIGYNEAQIVATLKSSVGTKKFDILDSSTLVKTQSYVLTANATFTTIKVIPTQTQYLQLLYSNFTLNVLLIYDKSMVLIQQITLTMMIGIMNFTISEDQSAITIWDYKGYTIFIYYSGPLWVLHSYYNPPVSSAMNTIAMSKNGSIVILQNDSQAIFSIINFRSISSISSKNFANTIINQAIFLDEDCHLIALTVNYTTLQIYDTFTLTLQSSTVFDAVSNYSVIDYSLGALYLCLPSSFQIYNILCPSLSYRSTATNECINCSLPSNCNGCDQDTGICNSCDQNYTLNSSTFECQSVYIPISSNTTNSSINFMNLTNTNSTIIFPNSQKQIKTISPTQALIANATLQSFNVIDPVITTIFSIIQMSPFALIFLSFMNYWNLCCLYSILNVKTPYYLSQIHEKIFQSIQTSIFQNIGFSPKLPSLDNYIISSTQYKINYNIALDFVNPNLQNFLMILFVFALLLITICFRNLFLKKTSFLYNLFKFSVVQSLIGQFISFVPFCILPYRFLVNKTGLSNFSQKLNLILQVFLLILCFLAPCLFIWSRSQTYIESQVKKSKFFKEISKDQLKSKNLMQKIKSKDTKTQNQNFKELQMLIVNISVPLLIILPIYYPFFIVNLAIFFYSIKKASKSSNYRINSIITACYLPLYHSCYIVFFLFGQNEIISHYVGLFCLVMLFLGGIHELCNVVLINLIEFFKWLIKTLKQNKIESKIPKPSKSEKNQLKSRSFKPQLQFINFGLNGKVANSYNQNQETKVKKSFKSKKTNNIIQQKDQTIKKDLMKSKVKGVKFKMQRTYKKELDISKTSKLIIKNVSSNDIGTSNVLQKQEHTLKKPFNRRKIRNDQKSKNQQSPNDYSNFELQKFNQELKKDYIQRKIKTGKNLPRYLNV